MFSVALTGNVAAGKSSVAEHWRRAGVPVISSDQLARDVVRPGSDGLAAVVAAFGAGVLAEDGSLNRALLRQTVFRNPDDRRRLEAILHPRIWRLRTQWTGDREREGHALVVAEVPLLFEAGLERQFDATVLVDAPEDVRLSRLIEHRHMERSEARRIMEAQLDPRIKRARADYVLDNTGSLAELTDSASELLDELRDRATTAMSGEGPASVPDAPESPAKG